MGKFTNSNNDIRHPNPAYKESLAEIRQNAKMVIPYQRPDWINTKEPESVYYRDEWQKIPFRIAGSDDPTVKDQHLSVCLASQWKDFMLHYGLEAFNSIGIDGYYFDGGLPLDCKNTHHGCGWVDEDGKLQTSYPILAFREFYRRLATALYQTGRPYIIKIHTSNCTEMPTCSFVSFLWDGEQFSTSVGKAGGYTNLLSPAQYRAEFLGQQFGIPVQMLIYSKTSQEADSLLAFSLAHGMADMCLAGGGPPGHFKPVLDAQDTFGIRETDAQFVGYWEAADYVSGVNDTDEILVCSLWKRPGKVLLVLSNFDKDSHSATVTLNTKNLKLNGNLRARDMVTGEAVAVDGAIIEANVYGASWRLIEVSR